MTLLEVLEAADAAATKMTTHKDADAEVEALKARYVKVKAMADQWTGKVDILKNLNYLLTFADEETSSP